MTQTSYILRAEWLATMAPPVLGSPATLGSPLAVSHSAAPEYRETASGQPAVSPVIHDGAVAIADGRILAAGAADEIIAAHRSLPVENLGAAVLLPGLVNAHTHLELTGCTAGESPGGSFADWILTVRSRMKQPADGTHFAAAGAIAGMAQSLKFGVTAVGDITQHPTITRPTLRGGPLRVVSYGEVLGLGKMRDQAIERLALAIDRANESPALHTALSPHAPYTVDLPTYERCLATAVAGQLPLATHLAENPQEREFLVQHAGPFRGVWDKIDQWNDGVVTHTAGPIEFANAIGLLAYPKSLLAHVNYCDDAELALLAKGKASVVYCPRTHAYFRHPPHRWRDMLAAGINVAVGTDSCASSPDLNLVDELRLLRRIAPDVPAIDLWAMATIRAARAIGLGDVVGSITPRKMADLVAFPASGDDPLATLLDRQADPMHVWINGVPLLLSRYSGRG